MFNSFTFLFVLLNAFNFEWIQVSILAGQALDKKELVDSSQPLNVGVGRTLSSLDRRKQYGLVEQKVKILAIDG